jgi:hypothetical protein
MPPLKLGMPLLTLVCVIDSLALKWGHICLYPHELVRDDVCTEGCMLSIIYTALAVSLNLALPHTCALVLFDVCYIECYHCHRVHFRYSYCNAYLRRRTRIRRQHAHALFEAHYGRDLSRLTQDYICVTRDDMPQYRRCIPLLRWLKKRSIVPIHYYR